MEGTAKRQANAEDMLAELKRAVESSTRTPQAPPPSASTAPKPASTAPKPNAPSQKPRRAHWGIDPPGEANGEKPIGPRTGLEKRAKPSPGRRKLRAGGLALGGVAAFFAGVVVMNEVLNHPAHEFSLRPDESLVRPQDQQALEPSSSVPAPPQAGQRAAPSPARAGEARPDASQASANDGSLLAPGNEDVVAPHLASFGLEFGCSGIQADPAQRSGHPGLHAKDRAGRGPDGARALQSRFDRLHGPSGSDAEAERGSGGRLAGDHSGRGASFNRRNGGPQSRSDRLHGPPG